MERRPFVFKFLIVRKTQQMRSQKPAEQAACTLSVSGRSAGESTGVSACIATAAFCSANTPNVLLVWTGPRLEHTFTPKTVNNLGVWTWNLDFEPSGFVFTLTP